jgi:hypothetical protein
LGGLLEGIPLRFSAEGSKRNNESLQNRPGALDLPGTVDVHALYMHDKCMPHWRSRPQITVADVEQMVQAHKSLELIIQGLQRSSSAGAGGTIAALAVVDQWICALFNRVEPWYEAYLEKVNRTASAKTSKADPQSADEQSEADAVLPFREH